jgi:dihydroneopterin aldolase
MRSTLIIERLVLQARCGVTAEERARPQPMAVDLELEYDARQAAAADDIARAVDYAQVTGQIGQVAAVESFVLVETFATRLMDLILEQFPVTKVRLWLRKTNPPVPDVAGSVGVRLERLRPAPSDLPHGGDQPAEFLAAQLSRLPKGRALDLAAGRGRNALWLAARGWAVEAFDRDEDALTALADAAKARHLTDLTVRRVDLEADPVLPAARYDVIVVCFYLQRTLFPAIIKALKPGGMLLYETFLIDNHVRYQHPRRKEFCLGHNELLLLVSPLRVLHYDEGERHTDHGGHAITARLLAERPEQLRGRPAGRKGGRR